MVGGVTAATVATTIATGLLSVFGFSSQSFAAWWQSSLHLIQAGELYKTLQSIAMSGVAASLIFPASIGGAAGAA